MNNWIVYKHTSPSGKVYIGITSKECNRRWRSNGSGYLRLNKDGKFIQPYFANAIIKYGWNNISHEILFNNLSESEAKLKEKELIQEFKNNCYNLTSGGDGVCGRIVSKETRLKMSQAHLGHAGYNKGCHLSEETKAKISSANKGRKMSDESKLKISISRKGIKFTKQHLLNMSLAQKGKTPWNKGKQMSDESKLKMSLSKKGVSRSEETKKKISKAFSIKVEIDGIVYNSYKDAAKSIGVSSQTISRRIKDENYKNYKLL